MVAVFAYAPESSAKADLSSLTRLDGVSVYSDSNEARVVLRFDKKLALKTEPVFFERSVQFDIKDVYVSPAKRKFKLRDSLLTSAVAYQLSPSMVRVRLFTSEDSRSFKQRWSMSFNDGLMIFKLKKHDQVIEASHAGPSKEMTSAVIEAKPNAKETDSVESVKKLQIEPLKPSDAVEKSGTPSADISRLAGSALKKKGFLAYKEPQAPESPSTTAMFIKMIASLCLVLSFVFALAWVAKHYLGRFNAIPGYSNAVRVLTTGSIGGKKLISVVDIAGEILILGVTDERITLLSNISDKESIGRIRSLTASAEPAAPKTRTYKNLPERTSWAPELVKSAVNFLRIGKSAPAPQKMRAVFDESDPDTFAGQMTRARGRAGQYPEAKSAPDTAPGGTGQVRRGDMINRVTNSIRKRNSTLTIA